MATTPIQKMVTITVDGISAKVPEGTLVIEAARQVGVMIPHFCYHPKLEPDANCRMCLVEIEKTPKLQTSCSTRVADGMVVRSSVPHVETARKSVLELLLGNHPLDCPVCDQGGRCDLQDFSHEYTPTMSRFTELKRVFPKEYLSPVIETQMNRCVSCMRCVRYCDEVMDAKALAPVGRGTLTKISHWAGNELECDFCGGCIQICPVGAITSRLSMYDFRPWMLKRSETICNFCGDGCQMTVQRKNQDLIEVNSTLGAGRNDGDLCAKGYFGYHANVHPDRLKSPLIRQADGSFATVTWEEALDCAAEGLTRVKTMHGADAIGGLITARCTNEELYAFQKFMRGVIGTNHIDSSARYGYINGVKALQRIQGTHRWAITFEDIVNADTVLLVGTSITESNPITGLKVKQAIKRHGAKLITLETAVPAFSTISNITTLATHHLTVLPGHFDAAVLGLIKSLAEQNLINERVSGKAPEFCRTVIAEVEKISWQEIEQATGLGADHFHAASQTLSQAERLVVLAGQGVLRSLGGEGIVTNLLDLLILTGHHGDQGSGLGVLAEENNEQGALEMGVVADYFPGPSRVGNDSAKTALAKIWGLSLPATPGATMMEMFDQARQGSLKAMFIVGENPVESLPSDARISEALDSLEFLVCQELYMTETAKRAHVIFPASSAVEKDGTFTNSEGHVQPVRNSIEPLGESLPDWEIFSALSVVMDTPMEYAEVKEIFKEIRGIIPQYALLGPSSKPHRVNSDVVDHYLRQGFQEDVHLRYARPQKALTGEGIMTLVLGQSMYHSGKFSTRSKGLLEIQETGMLSLNPMDANRIGVEDGARVCLSNEQGEVTVSVKLVDRIPVGVAWFPEHFDQEIRRLFHLTIDERNHVPCWKTTEVHVARVS
ncbi:NADH-quinone oxidoreductase subunit NuoG [Candidatus Nitronereus thalassa]|uniref:NADH-quinone oxidoreductase n=1 Tax=Candidatus Nitronereus thalassa TaxID=3020898 RepID=A0ABU3K5I9_9BACT|nr:NADH-quinone oxidoreductase subunit NuoG [Candidatus Nitronereus thalassa]MDT7041634.1 NADH-quinone oxidoreductase subunit NuoG [Candidatus Nitronereus thalassa]